MAHEFSPLRTCIAKPPLWGSRLLVVLACAAGCTPQTAPALQPPPVEVKPAPAPAAPPVVQPDKPGPTFRLGKVVEIKTVQSALDFPKLLSSAELANRFLPRAPQPGLWAMLDQHPARAFSSRQLKLTALLNEDEELAPGFHWLSLFQESGSEQQPSLEVSLSAFAVETETEGMPLSPGCALLWPVGTYNGAEAAKNIRVLAVPRQAEVSSVRYLARAGDWQCEGTFDVGQIVLLDSPPDGDIEIAATCFVKEESLSPVSQVITVNSDAQSSAIALPSTAAQSPTAAHSLTAAQSPKVAR